MTNNFFTSAAIGHRLIGHVNPRCSGCGQALMWLLAHPTVTCETARQLLLDRKPTPAKAGMAEDADRKAQ